MNRFIRSQLSWVVVLALLLTLTMPAYAADMDETTTGPTNESESDNAPNFGEIFGFDITQGNFATLDTSSFYEFSAQMDMSAFNQLKYDIPSNETNAIELNLQYTSLLDNMKQAGYGTQFSLEVPEFSVGYSSDIKTNFDNIYGTVTSLGGWTMADIMAPSSNRQDVVGEYMASEAYQSVYQSVNLGSLIGGANNMTGNITNGGHGSTGGTGSAGSTAPTNNNGFSNIDDKYQQNLDNLNIMGRGDIEDLYEKACGEAQTWMEKGAESNHNSIYDTYQDTLDKQKLEYVNSSEEAAELIASGKYSTGDVLSSYMDNKRESSDNFAEALAELLPVIKLIL